MTRATSRGHTSSQESQRSDSSRKRSQRQRAADEAAKRTRVHRRVDPATLTLGFPVVQKRPHQASATAATSSKPRVSRTVASEQAAHRESQRANLKAQTKSSPTVSSNIFPGMGALLDLSFSTLMPALPAPEIARLLLMHADVKFRDAYEAATAKLTRLQIERYQAIAEGRVVNREEDEQVMNDLNKEWFQTVRGLVDPVWEAKFRPALRTSTTIQTSPGDPQIASSSGNQPARTAIPPSNKGKHRSTVDDYMSE